MHKPAIGGHSGLEDPIPVEFLDAAWKAVEQFPVDAGAIEPVMQSENVTFRVVDRSGGKTYVLRLHRPGYNTLGELESERIWVDALRETGISVPETLLTSLGEHYALVDIPGLDEQRYAGMMTWLEGKALGNFLQSCADQTERKRMFRKFGEMIAALHNQAVRWRAPPGFFRRRMDCELLLGDSPFWGPFWEHPELNGSEKALLLKVRRSLVDLLEAYGEQADKFSMIHADFTLDNIIYDGSRPAVIDFDDCAYGWHMYDFASLLFECTDCPDFGELQEALFEGYRQARSLTPQDVEIIPDFLLIRGMAYLGWYHQRPGHPHSADVPVIKNWVIEQCASRT